MIGIDHSRASIAYREMFSFTKAGAMEAMKNIKNEFAVNGCLLLSTCNRTELWISYDEKPVLSPYDMLCRIKGVDRNQYGEFFVERQGSEAADHLLRLTCGLNSKIFGEDQIISQVREALALSRKCGCEDMVIEKLFQTAIAAGKKVKSKVRITAVDQSTAHDAVQRLKSELGALKDIRCLIIGNGQMGKLVANVLAAQGARVTMTLRKKIHNCSVVDSIVPEGCTMLPYEERYEALDSSQVVISATLSPHFTLVREEVEAAFSKAREYDRVVMPSEAGHSICKQGDEGTLQKRIWLDLAVPRDMDPEIAGFAGIRIYDIDTLSDSSSPAANGESVEKALRILDKYAQDIERWFAFRKRVPYIQQITQLVAEDTEKRLGEPVTNLSLQSEQEEQLRQDIQSAAERAVGKILFGLRDTLSAERWDECLRGVLEAAKRDTLKTGTRKDRYQGRR